MSVERRWHELFGRQSGFRKTETQSEQVPGFLNGRANMGIGFCRLRPYRDVRRSHRYLGFRTDNLVCSGRRRHPYGERRRRRQLRRVVGIGRGAGRRSRHLGNVSPYGRSDGIRGVDGHRQPRFRDVTERKAHHRVQRRLRIRFQAFVFGHLRRRVRFRIRRLGRNVGKPSGGIVIGSERRHNRNPRLPQRRGDFRNHGNLFRQNRETNLYPGRYRQPSRSRTSVERAKFQLRRNAGGLSQMLGRQFLVTTWRRHYDGKTGSRGRYRFGIGSVQSIGRG